VFFFSSRRRHTRSDRDWSSDVCSSDLWEAAVKAHAEKQRVRGQVTQSIKGGFIVDVNGVAGFLPASLADLRPVRSPERMLHTGVRCYIIEINEAKKQIVLSRKAALEEEAGQRQVEMR